MRVHLLLDESSVASVRGDVRFALNRATKHPHNPVLRPGEPHEWDSLQVSWPGTVLYSPRDKKFRCWYAGLDTIQHPNRCWLYGYAESDDGINWTKPKLDQATFLDRPTNMIKPGWLTWPADRPVPTWGTYMLSSVFENPRRDAPDDQRFGAYWLETIIEPDGQRTRFVKALAWSSDGIHWTRACTAYELLPYVRRNFHDVSQIVYDPDDADPAWRVKAYSQLPAVRAYDGRPEVRHIGLLHGTDFTRIQAAAEPVVLAPQEGIDEEIHFATVRKIGGTSVMLFESNHFAKNPIRGDLRVAVSNDGRQFRRVHAQSALVPTGEKGMWDENLLVTSTSAMQEVGDEIRIYYFGTPNVYNAWPASYTLHPLRRGSLFYPVHLGFATLPRDRFAYAEGPGEIDLDLVAGDDGLWLNADGDDIEVRAGPATGRLTSERRHSVYRKVAWDRHPNASDSLHLRLSRDARLYSVEA